MNQKYYESADLVDRLFNAAKRKDRDVTFLVGSALSLPDRVGGYGVPGVSDMVDLIRREFEGSDAEAKFEKSLREEPLNPYQSAFAFLHGRRGQDAANRIVRTAVWQALDTNNWPPILPPVTSPHDADSATCEALEGEVDAWVLPRPVDLLGNLLVTCSNTFGSAVLTTNFDPLIEVSVSKHGGRCYRTVLHNDGKLGQTVAEGTHIVHLHGYWHGYDTLHTRQQLGQPRPQLGRSLARVVEASTLVVIGYGGWDDVITQTLVGLLSDSESKAEILWAFHEEDTASIEASNRRLLDVLQPGIGQGRVLLYRDIDCLSILSEVNEKLKPSSPAAPDPARGPRMIQPASADSDRPLFVDPWVGREQELSILASSSRPVAFVTGLGGQGKSATCWTFSAAAGRSSGRSFRSLGLERLPRRERSTRHSDPSPCRGSEQWGNRRKPDRGLRYQVGGRCAV